MRETTYSNIVCTYCGCCCDDIEITVQDNKITGLKKACTISKAKYLNYNKERLLSPLVRSNGTLKETTFEEAVDRAASILAESRYPILYGWSSTSNEATSLGIELAETVGGVIDNTSTVCHGPTILGIHDAGESTGTLGLIRHRADLIIYWGCNPVHAHPRHMTRFFLSRGRFRKSLKERKLVVFDVRETDTSRTRTVHKFVRLNPNEDYELLSALRSAVRGDEIEKEEVAGIPLETIEELADLMISCQFGVIFYGLGLTMSAGKDRNIEAALSLVSELNSKTKFLIMPLRGHGNVTGTNKIITWQTGYPYAVDFSQGYPSYNPGDTTTVDILSRRDCDAALVVASDPFSNFPVETAKYLGEIPLITIDIHMTPTAMVSDVVLPSAALGIEAEGTVYRMDAVPLVAKKFIEPPEGVKSDEEVLSMILKRVREIKG
ncbi:MAG: formylmethanofuran dehydrogenase subunit B [Nitrososphaeria archaeon]|nr:formylmethanofuran dehydrogenase subunit B [Nitrososphaeria archaeon]NIN51608.1 formylmethanofuran dehydrogenase subunit B [Nitrososphaeria archaeon]NIQ32093.1 formylmethanofuran dehydrogenase subunit B [Nitrososphaeria archaeon]